MSAKKRHDADDEPDSDILPGADAHEDAGEAEDGSSPRVRLNKFLASQGVASRRKCDELISGGRVSVDGRVVRELGVRVDPATQEIEVDGQVFRAHGARQRYYLLNKPKGVVCTNEERETRPRAAWARGLQQPGARAGAPYPPARAGAPRASPTPRGA